MKCSSCGHEVVAGAKFCLECGAKLDRTCPQCGAVVGAQARFCTQCGAKLSDSGGAGAPTGPADVGGIVLAPLAGDLPACGLTIHRVTAEGPNDIGDLSITVRYEVSNGTAEDWEYLEVRTQLLDAGGRVVDETRDAQERTVGAGESAEFEASLWGVKAKALGPVPEHAHVVVSVVACGMGQAALGEIAIPAEAFSLVPLRAGKVGEALSVVSGTLWKTETDDDKDARVEVKLLVQNLTARHLPKVQLVAAVTDSAGRELLDAGGYEEVRPAAICVVGGSGYAKDKKLAGAKAELSIRAYWPVAAGCTQRQGCSITTLEHDDGKDEDSESRQNSPLQELTAASRRIASEFREDPRNKVYVPFGTLTLSAAVELGRLVSPDEAARAVVAYLGGEVSDDDQVVYDGMVAVCGEITRSCFGEDDEDLDYSIDWVDDDEGWTAVVRPS